jgi:hypothetical protein
VKKWLLGIVMAVALVGLALLLRNRDELPATPTAAVSALIDAAREADAAGYLKLTSGPLREKLDQTRNELGDDGFRGYLRQFGEGIKGLAVPAGDEPEGDTITLDVEFIFADRNERQQMTFQRRGTGWTITSMETAQMVKPPVPYGTPVFGEAP